MTAPTTQPRSQQLTLGRGLARERGNFTWVYLWGAPLRAMHWTAALSILVLIVTGLFVARPYVAPTGDTTSPYLMGRMRFFHFVAAAVIVMTGIVRFYWLFAGNRFERLRALFPFTSRNLGNLWRTTLGYLTLNRTDAPVYVGHNPLQQVLYTGTYVTTAVMVLTGFALYGQSNPGGTIHQLFNWVVPLLGGLQIVRLIHHALTYGYILFIIFHVYFAARADYVERAGVISSIITGGRYIPANDSYEDYDVEKVPAQPRASHEHPMGD
jgi:Ni/Fe-hydrogenase 1 B-type cytochrome subunit